MSRNLHATDVLTEFARDFESEEPDNLISRFVSRISNAVNAAPSNDQDAPSTSTAAVTPEEKVPAQSPAETTTPTQEESPKRTPLSVIKRISNMVAAKDTNLHSYKDTDLQKFWMPDAKSKECYDCAVKFTTFRRRHHCRLCGQIFCSKCCNQVVPGKIIKCSGDLKVCTYCSKVVLSYIKSPDITADLRSDLQALQVDLTNKLAVPESEQNQKKLRKASVGYQEERHISSPNLTHADRRNILQQSTSLKMLAEEMSKILSESVDGQLLVDFMMSTQKSAEPEQAKVILTALIDAGFLIPIDFPITIEGDGPHKHEFDAATTYKLLKSEEAEIETLPPTPETTHNVIKDFESQESFLSTVAAKPLLESFCDHEEQLMHQLLRKENVDECWSKVLIPICVRVANTVRPETCNVDFMDIRNFINFKKVPEGQKSESKIVNGVVFSKNVTHKDMPTHIEKPKVLLLQCGILFQREDRLVSLDNLLLQEQQHLRNMAARILSYGANIVLVHKSVSGVAQDVLRENGVTLVLDVKLPILERLARCLQCDIINSIESNIGRPKLGTCDAFYRKTYTDKFANVKTLMFFETRYNPRGCCVVLRGGPICELNKIKKVASTMIFARYNWKHEMAFLLDEFAQPPQSKVFESPNQSPEKQNITLHAIKEEEEKNKMRKPEKLEVQRENVQECDDPLRSAEIDDETKKEISSIQLVAVQKSYDNKFRNALSTTILSISPNITFPLPYLETEVGRNCALRTRFPEELYYSKQWSTSPNRESIVEIIASPEAIELLPEHKYISHQITAPFDSKEEQNLLANFRFKGGRFQKTLKIKIIPPKPTSKVALHPQRPIEEYVYKDALDLDNHQRLSVLFYSYYSNPKATSSFCVFPYLLEMTFYGQNDIMLGLFLERYCFRNSYICKFCKLPMIDHVRRYVHSMGCVQVKLHEDTANKKTDEKSIMMSSMCGICNEWTPAVPMAKDTWCLSLAKYLELRFHGHSYKRHYIEKENRGCQHSIHRDYTQIFSCNGLVARINYEPIEIWEITLPPMFIRLKHLKDFEKNQVLDDIKSFAMKGYEVYAFIHDKIANLCPENENSMVTNLKILLGQDQLSFKQRVEVVQTLLTESNLNNYEINDAMLMMKRTLSESIEIWGPRLHEATLQAKSLMSKNDTNPIDNGTICTEDLQSDVSSPASVTDESDLDEEGGGAASSNAVEASFRHKLNSTDSKLESDKHDKKTIKQIFTQFLSSNESSNIITSPLSVYEHHTVPLGLFPILVHDQDISSIIAYSLISHDYKKMLAQSDSPKLKRKTGLETDSENEKDSKDEKEREKERIKKSHIDIAFQDPTATFSCKIYFAREFDALRSNFLTSPFSKDLDSNRATEEECEDVRRSFARSLCRSVKWEARGGKSGSKFCKTIDDQFVLKEMSKTDIGIFENFAPNYFDYINQCLTQKKPTLLAKIFGVYKITVKKKDHVLEKSVLVMEHLFVGREISNKFDLKGSERNRLVDPTNLTGEVVLLDENLMQSKYSFVLILKKFSVLF